MCSELSVERLNQLFCLGGRLKYARNDLLADLYVLTDKCLQSLFVVGLRQETILCDVFVNPYGISGASGFVVHLHRQIQVLDFCLTVRDGWVNSHRIRRAGVRKRPSEPCRKYTTKLSADHNMA